ncbi:MAG: TIGR02270 family protein [Rhizobacter sp.]|nr:TIGR02270 family protein [Rhizobacter sp.]
MSTTLARPINPIVVSQHVEDAASLRAVREVLVAAPHVKLLHLGRTDERLAAHLDGLAVAGADAVQMARAGLATPGIGQVFTCAVLAIEQRDMGQVERLLALTGSVPHAERALASAFGWVSPAKLRGLTTPLLRSASPAARRLGLASCALHGVDPGDALVDALKADDPGLRQRALRAAAQLGRTDLLPACLAALADDAPGVAHAAAWAALLLGERSRAIEALSAEARAPGPAAAAALAQVLKVLSPDAAQTLLRPLAKAPGASRALIGGIAVSGDPVFVPWLLKQMADAKLTRLAGEAFSMMTGLDLAYLDLDRKPPEGEVFGPNDDPADAAVALDEDESLPWPDPDRLAAWWQAHGTRFQPGTRYFVGEPPSVAHCLQVLKTGFQRQRIAAAEYFCLLKPGTPLFNVAAPTWRQERQLAKMGV